MDIRSMIYHLLTNVQKCKVREEAGIWYITTPSGVEWDMTIPMERLPKEQKSDD